MHLHAQDTPVARKRADNLHDAAFFGLDGQIDGIGIDRGADGDKGGDLCRDCFRQTVEGQRDVVNALGKELQGIQIARGDLNTLKLLSQGVYDITLAFDCLPETIAAEVATLVPIRSSIDANTIDLTIKTEEGRVMEIVSALSRDRRVLRVEVHGASLEDIFVELTTQEGKDIA